MPQGKLEILKVGSGAVNRDLNPTGIFSLVRGEFAPILVNLGGKHAFTVRFPPMRAGVETAPLPEDSKMKRRLSS